MKKRGPQRIICMTEESVETLYLLGREDLIVGVSSFVKRPPESREKKKISGFTHANIKKIVELKPDLILGFSDIQKDIAKELIGLGFNVFIANHRSLTETLDYIVNLGSFIGERDKALELVHSYELSIETIKENSKNLSVNPKVYIEEWDDPMISGIQWVSEIVEICGGKDICSSKSHGVLAKDRFISKEFVRTKNPDIILASWCGKKVDLASFEKRLGWSDINAIKTGHVYELEPEIFLQPGPALFESGLNLLSGIIQNWSKSTS